MELQSEYAYLSNEMEMKANITQVEQYAQDQLGDLVFVNLPQEGDEVEVGAAFGDVESVKAVSDVYSPVSGVVCAINEELLDHPELINQDAYGAWMIQVNEVSDKEELLSSTDYEALLSQEA